MLSSNNFSTLCKIEVQDLIKVSTNEKGDRAVSARALYIFFDVKSDFTTWCKRMFNYGFIEGQDYVPKMEESSGGRPSVDYVLTLVCAKEIAMVQRSEKGKQARLYFIECEKQLRRLTESKSRRSTKYLKQGKEPNWVDARIKGIGSRNGFTSVLAQHGVEKDGFRDCTTAIYKPLYGGSTGIIRQKKGLTKNAPIRDNLPLVELTAIALTEALAAEQIERNNLYGNTECASACHEASKSVAGAVNKSRKQISSSTSHIRPDRT